MTTDASEAWIRALRATLLFAKVEQALLEPMVRELREVVVDPDQDLVRQDDEGTSLFVIVEGTLKALYEEGGGPMELQELGPGSIVGELALVIGGKRSATVRAVERTRALELSREAFDRLLEQDPSLMDAFTQRLQERMRRVRVVRYLHDIFGALESDALRELEQELTWIHLPGGKELFVQGDRADGAYIVVTGRLRVAVADGAGGERIIDDVLPGEWVGEMALLTRQPRSGTVYALRGSQLVWLPQEAFDRLVVRHPTAMQQLTRLLVDRMQRLLDVSRPMRRDGHGFVVVAARPGLDVSGLCERLRAMLSRHGATVLLTAERVDAALGKPGIAHSTSDDVAHLRLVPWLTEQENEHDYLVYQADAEWTGWSRTAARWADHVLVVTDAAADPALGATERRLRAMFEGTRAPPCSLVLLQRSGPTSFPGTRRWLDPRPWVDQHYHLRQGSQGDLARMVRLLTNRAVSLVLGGGGSRGYAHVGVLRAFEELGIPVDAVAGSSIGAVVAGSHALGLRWSELLTVLRPIFNSLVDPTLPIVSLASGRNAVRGTERVVGSLDIEDLAIPYFCISTNLTRNREVVHRRGSLALAARASGSLPGIFPPVPGEGGDLLVDGGVCNNVPIDVMDSLFPGAIVGVDVMPEVDLSVGKDLPTHLSGWSVAWRMLNPLQPKVGMPNILSILIRAATIGSTSMRHAQVVSSRAALFLKPHVEQWNLLDFKAAPSIAEQGYQSTREQIGRWWADNREVLLGAASAEPEPRDP